MSVERPPGRGTAAARLEGVGRVVRDVLPQEDKALRRDGHTLLRKEVRSQRHRGGVPVVQALPGAFGRIENEADLQRCQAEVLPHVRQRRSAAGKSDGNHYNAGKTNKVMLQATGAWV